MPIMTIACSPLESFRKFKELRDSGSSIVPFETSEIACEEISPISRRPNKSALETEILAKTSNTIR
jgi:hypothetical protein